MVARLAHVRPTSRLWRHEALQGAGATSTLTIVPGAGHGDPLIAETVTEDVLATLAEVFGR